jgi:hypothetical protein
MPHKSVAVVAAMARELAPMLRGVPSRKVDGIDFFEFADTAVAVGGIGRKCASRTAEALIRRYSPGVLISAGLVGALTPELKVGNVVEVKEVVDADSGETFETGRGDVVLLTISGIAGPSDKPTDAQRWKADIVDMEASAEAAVAKQNHVEFRALKAVSDELNFAMPPLGKFVSDRGKFETLRFLEWVAIRPKWWSVVRQLNVNSNLAAANLSRALGHLIEQRVNVESERGIQSV